MTSLLIKVCHVILILHIYLILHSCHEKDTAQPDNHIKLLISSETKALNTDALATAISNFLKSEGVDDPIEISLEDHQLTAFFLLPPDIMKTDWTERIKIDLAKIMVRDSFSAKVIIEASQKSVLKKLQVTQLEYPVSFQKDSIQIQTGRELEQTEAPRELRGKEYGPDRCFFVSSYTENRSMLEYKSRFVGDKSSPLG